MDAEAGLFDAFWKLEERIDIHWVDAKKDHDTKRHRSLSRRWSHLQDAVEDLCGLGRPALHGPRRIRCGKAALFWFKADAGWHTSPRGNVVTRARAMVAELIRWDVEIRVIFCDDPGQILWQNRYQVLALPTAKVPRAFASGPCRSAGC
ncbi:MAG: hypothetical protein AAFV19_09155 [Pseudomonadota bacterium]